MILRVLALLAGVPLLLFGLLAVVIAVPMVGDPGRQGGPPPIAAQIVATVLMAGVAVTGAALTWLGLRKRPKPVAAETPPSARSLIAPELATVAPPQETTSGLTSVAAASLSVGAAPSSGGLATMQAPAGQHEPFGYAPDAGNYDEHEDEQFDSLPIEEEAQAAFEIGTSGRLIGTCGPKMSGQSHYYFVGGLVIAIGFALMIWLQVSPGAADPATASAVGLWLGGGLVLFGGVIVALQLMRVPQIISLYDDRLTEESGSKLRTVPLDQIARLFLQEFYEHRFAAQAFLVTVHVRGDRNLKFSTALGGDADLIVSCLAEIAPDVEVRKFVA